MTVIGRSLAHYPAKNFREMFLCSKSDESADISNGVRFFVQVEFCALNPCPQNILMRAHASGPGKLAAEVMGGDLGNGGQCCQADVAVIVRLYVGDRSFQPFLAYAKPPCASNEPTVAREHWSNVPALVNYSDLLVKTTGGEQNASMLFCSGRSCEGRV